MILNRFKNKYKYHSFSQTGEDLIIDFIFRNITVGGIKSYLDIGCYHPYSLNNTAIFYHRGIYGINVDSNPEAIKLFNKYRNNDINICTGVADAPGVLKYYLFEDASLNTISESEMKKRETELLSVRDIPVKTIRNIIDENCNGVFPDFLSLDVEGLDLDIIKSIDFNNSFPKVICVETILAVEPGQWEKQTAIVNFLKSKNYILHSDTGINSILIHRSVLKEQIIQ